MGGSTSDLPPCGIEGSGIHIKGCSSQSIGSVGGAIGFPGAVTTDVYGNVYFSSQTLVFKLDRLGVLTVVAGSWTGGYSGDGGPATQAKLNFPLVYPAFAADPIDNAELVGGLVVDSAGNLYIADAYNNRVRKVDASGTITTVAGTGEAGYSGDGAPATQARFRLPQGVAADSVRNLLYIADSNGALRRVTTDGVVNLIVGNNCGAHNLPGLCAPEEIATDSAGNVYVADGYCDIRKVSPAGQVVELAGDPRPSGGWSYTCGYSNNSGLANTSALGWPYSVAVDRGGNLYIADTNNSCIRKVDTFGTIATVAGICQSRGAAGDGGPATSALLNIPHGIAVDSDGNLYIADTGNRRIRKVASDGKITTVAGNGEISPAGLTSTTTLLGLAPTSAAVGQTVSLYATVSGAAPTGSIRFMDGSTALGDARLGKACSPSRGDFGISGGLEASGRCAGVSTAALAVGTHSIRAIYSGDAHNAASASTTMTEIIVP